MTVILAAKKKALLPNVIIMIFQAELKCMHKEFMLHVGRGIMP